MTRTTLARATRRHIPQDLRQFEDGIVVDDELLELHALRNLVEVIPSP